MIGTTNSASRITQMIQGLQPDLSGFTPAASATFVAAEGALFPAGDGESPAFLVSVIEAAAPSTFAGGIAVASPVEAGAAGAASLSLPTAGAVLSLAAGEVFSSDLGVAESAGAFSAAVDFSAVFVAAGVSSAWQRFELI